MEAEASLFAADVLAVVVRGKAACGWVSLGENGCDVSICWWLITDSRFPKKLESLDTLC